MLRDNIRCMNGPCVDRGARGAEKPRKMVGIGEIEGFLYFVGL